MQEGVSNVEIREESVSGKGPKLAERPKSQNKQTSPGLKEGQQGWNAVCKECSLKGSGGRQISQGF